MSRHSNHVYWTPERPESLAGLARRGRHCRSIASEFAIGPDVRSVVTEGAEQEAIRAPRHDGRGNSGGSGVGRNRKAFGEKLLGTGAVHALNSVSPARVALLVAALAPGILGRSPGCTAGYPARFAALTRWACTIGWSGVFVTRLTGLC